MITSSHNPKIQWLRKLQASSRARREVSLFVTEGVRLVEEAQNAGWQAELILYTEGLETRGQAIIQQYCDQKIPVEMVSEGVMRAASDTQTPQGLLAVLTIRSLPLPNPLDFVFIPDGIRDPGNLGTILRTAAAAGAQAILLPEATVDVYAPKVVRAAMGAHFRLPIRTSSWEEIGILIEQAGLETYLADANSLHRYDMCDFRKPLALIVGGEANGVGAQARKITHTDISIPMPGGSESLNAAIAAAVLLFEVVRQRHR